MTLRRILSLFTVFLIAGCEMLQPTGSSTGTAPRKPAPPAGGSGGANVPSDKPAIVLSSANGAPGQAVAVQATLRTGGASIAGTQNDIGVEAPQMTIASRSNGKPECSANGALGKEGTAFSFQPPGCNPASTCTGVRALVLSLSNVDPIANGAVLYTCKVRIGGNATAGSHRLTVSRAGFSDPKGTAINGVGVNGTITVGK